MAFCSNCGQKLAEGAKFCSGCGTAINGVNTNQTNPSQSNGNSVNNYQRRISYDGEILKCPNCGEVLNSFTTNCPSCGYELRGAKTSSSIQELARKLEELENKREKQTWSSWLQQKLNGTKLNVVDEQKISLIQNFPIPNTKEDILEFMVLASSNVKSKNHATSYAEERIIDAWNTKLEQTCQKALLNFGEDNKFLETLEHITGKKLKKREKKGFLGLW